VLKQMLLDGEVHLNDGRVRVNNCRREDCPLCDNGPCLTGDAEGS